MHLYGRDHTRREIEARVGRIDQIGGVRRFTLAEGFERGVEVIEVRTGGGLAYEACPDKGLDLGPATFAGVPLCWHGPAGQAHPAHFDPRGTGWHRTAGFGLMMTCGFDQVGEPGTADDGSPLPLHGRAHHTPARHVALDGFWEGDDYRTLVAGTVEQHAFAGERLTLRRRIASTLGENRIDLRDVLTNDGFRDEPRMVLYHFNLGWPLLDENATLEVDAGRVEPRSPGESTGGWDRFDAPSPDAPPRVCYHEDLATTPGGDGRPAASATLRQPRFPLPGGATVPLAFRLTWSADTLPRLVQWRMPQSGTYVLGLEPADCRVGGRDAERARGTLGAIRPGESRDYRLTIEVVAG